MNRAVVRPHHHRVKPQAARENTLTAANTLQGHYTLDSYLAEVCAVQRNVAKQQTATAQFGIKSVFIITE